jgi:hypothetical protein
MAAALRAAAESAGSRADFTTRNAAGEGCSRFKGSSTYQRPTPPAHERGDSCASIEHLRTSSWRGKVERAFALGGLAQQVCWT